MQYVKRYTTPKGKKYNMFSGNAGTASLATNIEVNILDFKKF